MNISEISQSDLGERLRDEGIRLQSGPFVFNVESKLDSIAAALHTLYADHVLVGDNSFVDFHVRVDRVKGIRGYLLPEVMFYCDNLRPFLSLPADSAPALLEWGLNWCISNYAHQYVLVHSAVLSKGGHAMILPAPPESGKSTLCASMSASGWRLLSDELALINPLTREISPLVRPIGLKNNSIDIIESRFPNEAIGPKSPRTPKGVVAHMRPPRDSVRAASEVAVPRWIVFPKFDAESGLMISKKPKSRAFMELTRNTNNFHHLGEIAFKTLTEIIDSTVSYDIRFSNTDDALSAITQISDG